MVFSFLFLKKLSKTFLRKVCLPDSKLTHVIISSKPENVFDLPWDVGHTSSYPLKINIIKSYMLMDLKCLGIPHSVLVLAIRLLFIIFVSNRPWFIG